MNYCILNGKKSTLIKGLLIQSLPPIVKPNMRTSIEEIDGRDGDIVTKLGFQAYDRPMTIGLFGDYDIDEVIEYFNSEGTVIFSNEPDKYYKYQILKEINFERLLRFKTATVTFHVQPFKYSAVNDLFSFSKNELKTSIYSATSRGIQITSSSNSITIKGTASANIEMYVPIIEMDVDAGDYTLKCDTEGTGESGCKVRLITNSPTDADSFGGNYLALSDSGTASLTATTEAKTFHYLWISIPNGAVVDFVMIPQLINDDLHSCKVVNHGNVISKPAVTIYGNDTIKLSINGVERFTIALANHGHITLDGAKMNAYKGDVLMNRSVSGDYSLLALNIGTNVLSWTGNVERIDIKDSERWV